MSYLPEYGGTGELPPEAYGLTEEEVARVDDDERWVAWADEIREAEAAEAEAEAENDAAWAEHERAQADRRCKAKED